MSIILSFLLILTSFFSSAPAFDTHGLPACTTEDSVSDCYWDAQHRGNHVGHSFIVLDGNLTYVS